MKTEAPVIKNDVFANLASLMTFLWLHIGDFCFLQITYYATHITNRGVAGNKTIGQITLYLVMELKFALTKTVIVSIAATIHGWAIGQI